MSDRYPSIWRPLCGPVEESPLAVCDARTLQDKDLVPMDMVYPHHIGENYQVKFNENQRWYYRSAMTDDECILIKNFDSKMDGRARREDYHTLIRFSYTYATSMSSHGIHRS